MKKYEPHIYFEYASQMLAAEDELLETCMDPSPTLVNIVEAFHLYIKDAEDYVEEYLAESDLNRLQIVELEETVDRLNNEADELTEEIDTLNARVAQLIADNDKMHDELADLLDGDLQHDEY